MSISTYVPKRYPLYCGTIGIGKNYENVFLHAPIFMDAADGAAKMMSISSFYIIGEKFIYPIDSSPGICDDMCNLLLSDLEAT
ncbi:hypothetical protein TNIN_138031 [Trichonephila inaurata madagascariensis]|uniref:Uncharacterized protein n=1 Tax=Trichonephila inaurata madagascariensis TaxID=2747483 RepID=A0A8X6X293_9ARAC|nr:hypothetical protein TNIN_138031 [Trichonephila inaurata madagascariensis]